MFVQALQGTAEEKPHQNKKAGKRIEKSWEMREHRGEMMEKKGFLFFSFVIILHAFYCRPPHPFKIFKGNKQGNVA
jgi:hypothetical protein